MNFLKEGLMRSVARLSDVKEKRDNSGPKIYEPSADKFVGNFGALEI